MQLFTASHQWASRPSDERFQDIETMRLAAIQFEGGLVERTANLYNLAFQPDSHGISVGLHNGPTQAEKTASLTYRAFGQVAARVGAPAGYLRQLQKVENGTQLVTDQLNALIRHRFHSESPDAQFLLHGNGRWDALAITSERYDRVHNSDVIRFVQRLIEISPLEWHNPPAYKLDDAGMEPSGLYLSQSDTFIFMVSENRGLTLHTGVDQSTTLNRGFFVSNDITGGGSLRITTFYYDAVCGNHIVWGARDVRSVRVRHIGSGTARNFMRQAVQYMVAADHSTASDEKVLQFAATQRIDDNPDTVVEAVSGWTGLPLKRTELVLEEARRNADQHGDPLTYWGMASGLTQLARYNEHANLRVESEVAAGRILDVAAEVLG